MKVLYTYPFCLFTPSLPWTGRLSFLWFFKAVQKLTRELPIEGPDVTLITDAKLPLRQFPCPGNDGVM